MCDRSWIARLAGILDEITQLLFPPLRRLAFEVFSLVSTHWCNCGGISRARFAREDGHFLREIVQAVAVLVVSGENGKIDR